METSEINENAFREFQLDDNHTLRFSTLKIQGAKAGSVQSLPGICYRK